MFKKLSEKQKICLAAAYRWTKLAEIYYDSGQQRKMGLSYINKENGAFFYAISNDVKFLYQKITEEKKEENYNHFFPSHISRFKNQIGYYGYRFCELENLSNIFNGFVRKGLANDEGFRKSFVNADRHLKSFSLTKKGKMLGGIYDADLTIEGFAKQITKDFFNEKK